METDRTYKLPQIDMSTKKYNISSILNSQRQVYNNSPVIGDDETVVIENATLSHDPRTSKNINH